MPRVSLLNIYILLNVVFLHKANAQDEKTLVKEDFTIRDFMVFKDSIFYVKKRNAYLFDRATNRTDSYFIGGYGLEIYSEKHSNTIITVANELVDTTSSVRFYNKKEGKFEHEFYYKKGKIIDFLNIPEASLFVVSLTNDKLIFYDYQDRPKFVKTIEIKLKALSRKLFCKDETLYFATDNGKVYKYNFQNYSKVLLYDAKALITEFLITDNNLIYSTVDGGIIKVDLDTNDTFEIKLKNNFISALELLDKNLICGSWDGTIFIVDIDSFSVKREMEIHKRAVLKIKKDAQNNLYSSSLDKTIKSWSLNN